MLSNDDEKQWKGAKSATGRTPEPMIELKELPGKFTIGALAVAWGTLLGFGYFSRIGIEFLSMANTTDWLYFLGVCAAPAIFMFLAAHAVYNLTGDVLRAREADPTKLPVRPIVYLALLVAVIVVGIVSKLKSVGDAIVISLAVTAGILLLVRNWQDLQKGMVANRLAILFGFLSDISTCETELAA